MGAGSEAEGFGEGRDLILIAEDEGAFADLLIFAVQKGGYRSLWARDGAQAFHWAREKRPALLLLDWMLPGASGLEVCRRLRADAALRAMPIIMITAKGEEADRVMGLETGADDYLVKPFSLKEMMARVEALLRRSGGGLAPNLLEAGGLILDRRDRSVSRGGRRSFLRPMEFRLLERLMSRPDMIFTRGALLDLLWDEAAAIEPRTVDVVVGRLRKSVTRDCGCDPVRTARGLGYIFSPPQAAQ